jgi:hypothetical protein
VNAEQVGSIAGTSQFIKVAKISVRFPGQRRRRNRERGSQFYEAQVAQRYLELAKNQESLEES